MKNTRKCSGCGRTFKPEPRNLGRQAFCSRPRCQRQRRTLQQKQRRQSARAKQSHGPSPGPGRRLQGASVISEADIRAENPVFIGLISMVTGLTNLEDIQRVYRQLWLQGKAILASGEGPALQNPGIISLLQKAEDPGRQAG